MPLLAVNDKSCQCWQTLYTAGICTIAFIKSIQGHRGSNHLKRTLCLCALSSSVLCLSTYIRTLHLLPWVYGVQATPLTVPHGCFLLCTLSTMRSVFRLSLLCKPPCFVDFTWYVCKLTVATHCLQASPRYAATCALFLCTVLTCVNCMCDKIAVNDVCLAKQSTLSKRSRL